MTNVPEMKLAKKNAYITDSNRLGKLGFLTIGMRYRCLSTENIDGCNVLSRLHYGHEVMSGLKSIIYIIYINIPYKS